MKYWYNCKLVICSKNRVQVPVTKFITWFQIWVIDTRLFSQITDETLLAIGCGLALIGIRLDFIFFRTFSIPETKLTVLL